MQSEAGVTASLRRAATGTGASNTVEGDEGDENNKGQEFADCRTGVVHLWGCICQGWDRLAAGGVVWCLAKSAKREKMGDGDGEGMGRGRGGIVRTPTFDFPQAEAETGAPPPTPPLHPGPRHSRKGPPKHPPFLTSHPPLFRPPRTNNFGQSPPFNSVSLNGCNGCTSVDDQGRPSSR